MPVFVKGETAPAFFVASRGHHADVGGISPGSMPPNSKSVDEEGVLFNGERIMRDGAFDEARVLELLASGAYPARNPKQNIADLKAQIASCMKGAEELLKLCEQGRTRVVDAYMGHVQDNAEEQVRRVIGALDDGAFEHRNGRRRDHPRAHHGRPQGALGRRRLHRHKPPTSDQLQRPALGDDGGRPLRLPLPDRQRHPTQRRLPAAA